MRQTVLAAILSGVFLMALGPALIRRDPIKSVDAVVLLLGNESTRVPEAMALLREGWAKTLIIPAEGKVFSFSGKNGLVPENRYSIDDLLRSLESQGGYEWYWENTHVELMLAREIMGRENVFSIAVVTSPYHTRRVGFILDKVFRDGRDPVVISSSFENTSGLLWLFEKQERRNVFLESIKNMWFFLYSIR